MAREKSRTPDDWRSGAACRDVPTELFFPVGQDISPEVAKLCRSCPVREECLAYAVVNPEVVGVWAATTEQHRVAIRRKLRPDRDGIVWETG